ncbi:MAG TPA: hypothetical protein VJ044_18895, partial [Candidatus Hodarchaeales archaeon]|nr:hypothetical protein [Candidatus Hodarchaeales archaeon]
MPESAKRVPTLDHRAMELLKNAMQTTMEQEVALSLDLGISTCIVRAIPSQNVFQLPSGEIIPWFGEVPIKRVAYIILDKKILPMEWFEEDTNLYYRLVPTSNRPILRISATPMHKKPFLDFIERLRPKGHVLDAGTGLGYSAVIASRTAEHVLTIEWDRHVLEIASYNPWSRELFDNKNVELRNADVTKEILSLETSQFDLIIHDGGTPKSSGEFFSKKHAEQLFRVLTRGGSLNFYLPRHGIHRGRDFAAGQISRLLSSGFKTSFISQEGSFA